MLETHAHKKFNFQHYRKTKMSQFVVFWSNREIKMPRNIVFRINREIKMPESSKIVQKTAKLKCRKKNFMPRNLLTLK